MKRGIFASVLIPSVIVFSFLSCATGPEPIVVKSMEEPTVEEEPVQPEAKEEIVEEETPIASPSEEEMVEETAAEAVSEEIAEEFRVSEEVFTETFEDIREIIDELNAIIREENYDRWLRYLAEEYIAHFSSAEVLRKNSEQPLLKKYSINLATLRDYFKYVVVPSRSNARLDDLVFIDNEHVKAIMIIKDRRTILYQLTKVDDIWKIGL